MPQPSAWVATPPLARTPLAKTTPGHPTVPIDPKPEAASSLSSFSVVRKHWLAAAWGFAESTLFFIVPDVLLTRVALENPKRAYIESGFALVGAIAGGAIMFAWGEFNPETARAALDAAPGIRPDMLAAVQSDLSEHGPIAVLGGPPRGVPYKIYAVQWGALGGGFMAFAGYSIPARLLRFLITAALASAARRTLLRRLTLPVCQGIHALFWLTFYAWYFYAMRA